MVSYHMGIGNLQSVLGAYGDDGASYAQLYFDASPDSHARAYRLLPGSATTRRPTSGACSPRAR